MNKSVVAIICIAFLLSGTGLAYLLVDKIKARKSQELLENEYKKKDEKIQHLQEETVVLKEKLKKKRALLEPQQEKLSAVFGEKAPSSEDSLESAEEDSLESAEEVSLESAEEVSLESTKNENIVPLIDCSGINNKIINFFSYLDTREYIKEYQLKSGTYTHFKSITSKLHEQKPIVVEKKFPGDILKNAYHFYRALSKRNIILIKDIIEKEKNVIEQTIDYFYQQHIRCKDNEMFLPPFDDLYEYSHFFLNTLGGTAYLFRLESRMRILLFYYSTMIIHEANVREINKYGIDIRPYIKVLEDELNNYSMFYYSDKYLNEIELVKKKYPLPYPVESS
ncbi:MAG TPA: hypothetical protein QF836_00990 [Nitrospinota bacterium]|jgi:hypothetical protein|nr:hypothetical protein [Nitrospinota bacterium]